jgi:hypothetical protein
MARFSYQTYDTDLVFAAAAAAYRIHGNQYVKAGEYHTDENGVTAPVQPNRDTMKKLLSDSADITDSDRQSGQEIRRHYQGLSFKILAGKVLAELDAKALAFASGDTVSERDLGILAYLPRGYETIKKRQIVEDRIQSASGGLVGKVGDKVTLNVEAIRTIYSKQWNVYFVSAITENDQSIFFSFKQNVESGTKMKIQGTVKAHRDGQTQLNRVRKI